ncbi:MAG TPA: ATP-binding protein, partial [Acidimicrobiia bacterium]|nr:ATP-binding protein [Acidimicrobiia bacterium]
AERLREADQMRSDFLALVSHELRTPLTAAKGFVDTVLYQWDRLEDDRRKELLARASRNAEELTRLIDKLLAYSGLEAHPVLDVRPVALGDAIEHVREHCAPALGDHPIVVDVPDRLYARADAHAFGHLLENLLTNAAKFAPTGTPIIVSATVDGAEIAVRVTDEGPGIPESEQEKVFERFYRSPAHRNASRGTGLGLTIARRAADALGGRLWVESEPGYGASFVFTLPAATVSAGPGLTPTVATDRLDQPV